MTIQRQLGWSVQTARPTVNIVLCYMGVSENTGALWQGRAGGQGIIFANFWVESSHVIPLNGQLSAIGLHFDRHLSLTLH